MYFLPITTVICELKYNNKKWTVDPFDCTTYLTTTCLNTKIEYIRFHFTAFQWTLIAKWAGGVGCGNAAWIYNPPNLWQIVGEKSKTYLLYITREIAHTRKQKTTTNAEGRATSSDGSQDVGVWRCREGWFSGGGTSHRNREVDGAPDGDGPLVVVCTRAKRAPFFCKKLT